MPTAKPLAKTLSAECISLHESLVIRSILKWWNCRHVMLTSRALDNDADDWSICWLVLLAQVSISMASQIQTVHIKPIKDARLNILPRDVLTKSSLVKCSQTCRLTSWCTSANLSPDRTACQLLSEEVSDMTSLQSAEGWSYLRKC